MNAAAPALIDVPVAEAQATALDEGVTLNEAIAFSPSVRVSDPLTASWLAEATLRLRREVCWLWQQRGGLSPTLAEAGGLLPPSGDALLESLELGRFAEDRRRLFAEDATAAFLQARITALRAQRQMLPGPWLAITERLRLGQPAQFALALGLLAHADPASGPVLAACQNDATRLLPTLALARRLFDDEDGNDPGLDQDDVHALFQHALLVNADGLHEGAAWHLPFEAGALVAQALLRDDGRLPPELRLRHVQTGAPRRAGADADEAARLPDSLAIAAHLLREPPPRTQFVPLLGDAGCDFAEWATRLAALHGRALVELIADPLPEPNRLAALAAWCWLYQADALLPLQQRGEEHAARDAPRWPRTPLRWLVPMHDLSATSALPQGALQAAIVLPATDFATRVRRFAQALGPRAGALAAEIEEAARRFRLGPTAIAAVGAAAALEPHLDGARLQAICRSQARPDLGSLAQRVEPRFALGDMVLPAAQMAQLQEIAQAMRALTRVHYGWGTARTWNDAGLSVVFCGPPGTGKTMAAEALANELQLPMFRIDLSQVVNKYIGETEKNLKRVFDAAEESDAVIFFDEADALFGKRTNVKDAHDRFANIEISYLLERMERLKGIAVLATNRRKDLDEAFLRRLRYLIEFPLPGERERERLWRGVFPPGVDTSALDFPLLARLFPLAGGHIRSIAFNASLQAARDDAEPRIDMPPVLVAVKRELDKLNRPHAPETFGPYEALLRPLFAESP